MQVAFFVVNITSSAIFFYYRPTLRFEVQCKCTFSTIKCTSFSQAGSKSFQFNPQLQVLLQVQEAINKIQVVIQPNLMKVHINSMPNKNKDLRYLYTKAYFGVYMLHNG